MTKAEAVNVGLLLAAVVMAAACGDDSSADTNQTDMTTAPTAPMMTAPAPMTTAPTTPMMTAPAAGAGAPAGSTADPACIAEFTNAGRSTECAMCACTMCATQAAALDSAPADVQALARDVITCGQQMCCAGTQCYCGDADLVTCSSAPAGPCITQIEAAAGAQGIAGIAGPCSDPNNACGIASALGRCLTGDATMMVAGMCPSCGCQ